jgi:hypothetical protein
MTKLTRRFKKNRKNRTIKKGGASDSIISSTDNNEDKKGILDIVGDKISSVASSALTNVEDVGLKIAGLERIDKSMNNNDNLEKISNSASEIKSKIGNVVDKTGAAIISNVNEVLGSEAVNNSVKQAAEDTVQITGKLADTFNEAMNNPEVKAKVEEAIKNAGIIGSVAVEASKEPFNKVVDVASQEIPKAVGASVSGAIKVGTDAMAAVPGLGGIIEIGKMVNDSSKAASSVVEAGSEITETLSQAIVDTKENVEKTMKELEEKKKMAEKISNRTTESMNQFENPLKTNIKTGGRKTRRRFFKRKLKSKRVRFAI